MNIQEAKKLTLSLIDSFNKASQVELDLRKAGLKKELLKKTTINEKNKLILNLLDIKMIFI